MRARLVRRAMIVAGCTLLIVVSNGAASHAAMSPATRALLTRVGVLPGDLAPGYTVQLIRNGESLVTPTMDNCNFRFTTEAQRLARRQVDVKAPDGQSVGVATEAVLYRSAAYAAKALVEWRASVAACRPLTWVKGDVPAEDYRIDSESNRTSTSMPLRDNVDTNMLFRYRGTRESFRALVIGQRKGAVITLTYVYTTAKPAPSKVAALQYVARRTGERLAAAVR